MSRTIWLLSAYRSDSHAYWADGLTSDHPVFDWQVFELPGRHFAWRIRSNPLSWLDSLRKAADRRRPDLILASSMVDLATLKGLLPELADRPSLYYFHENQLAYPILPGQVESIEPVMVQLYGALAADRVAFNSRHNRDSFLAGLRALMARMPDSMPPDLPERLADKIRILPVAVDPIPPGRSKDPALLLWNHRWEHDKAPGLFADAVLELARSGREFRLALLGPRPGREPSELRRLRDALGDRIVAEGFLDRASYRAWLQKSGLVVSAARHEFQGISLLEAVSSGAWPIVPDALCYREQYPPPCRYSPHSSEALCQALADALDHPPTAAPSIDDWLGPALRPRWREALETD